MTATACNVIKHVHQFFISFHATVSNSATIYKAHSWLWSTTWTSYKERALFCRWEHLFCFVARQKIFVPRKCGEACFSGDLIIVLGFSLCVWRHRGHVQVKMKSHGHALVAIQQRPRQTMLIDLLAPLQMEQLNQIRYLFLFRVYFSAHCAVFCAVSNICVGKLCKVLCARRACYIWTFSKYGEHTHTAHSDASRLCITYKLFMTVLSILFVCYTLF